MIAADFAVVEIVYLTTLQATLPNATADELTDIALHWAGLPGRVADEARHLIDEEFEARAAIAHDVEAAHVGLLAAMAPTTRPTATTGGAK